LNTEPDVRLPTQPESRYTYAAGNGLANGDLGRKRRMCSRDNVKMLVDVRKYRMAACDGPARGSHRRKLVVRSGVKQTQPALTQIIG